MKIAFIGQFITEKYGGAEVSTNLLINGLMNKGIDIEIISGSRKNDFNYNAPIHLIPEISIIPDNITMRGYTWLDRYYEKKIHKIIQKIKPDILHIADQSLLTSSISVAERLSLPTVVTIRDYRFFCNLPYCILDGNIDLNCHQSRYQDCAKNLRKEMNYSYLKILYLRTLKSRPSLLQEAINQASHVITVSKYVKNVLRSQSIGNKISVVYNPPKRSESKTRNKLRANKLVIISGGYFTEKKGFHWLIEAFDQFMIEYQNSESDGLEIELHIIGDGPFRKLIEEKIKNSTHKNQIKYLGWKSSDELLEMIEISDLLIIPSIWPEPLSRMLIDSISLGTPVLSSNTGGAIEISEIGACVLYDNLNKDDFVEKLGVLISEKKTREKLVSTGREIAKTQFDNAGFILKHLEIYESLLD